MQLLRSDGSGFFVVCTEYYISRIKHIFPHKISEKKGVGWHEAGYPRGKQDGNNLGGFWWKHGRSAAGNSFTAWNTEIQAQEIPCNYHALMKRRVVRAYADSASQKPHEKSAEWGQGRKNQPACVRLPAGLSGSSQILSRPLQSMLRAVFCCPFFGLVSSGARPASIAS